MWLLVKTLALFVVTACAEIAGCYLPWLWLRRGGSAWLVAPAAACLALFAWLLTLHPTTAARTYAAYGGVYVTTALAWLWVGEQQRPTRSARTARSAIRRSARASPAIRRSR